MRKFFKAIRLLFLLQVAAFKHLVGSSVDYKGISLFKQMQMMSIKITEHS